MRPFHFAIACLIVSLCGCGGDAPPATTAPAATDNAAPAVPAAPTAGNSTPVGNLSPEATVRQFVTAFKEGRLETLWDLLPPSYQKDVNDVVREFGGQVDAETWDSLLRLSNRYLSVSLAKQSMMMQTSDFKNFTRSLSALRQVPGVPPVDFTQPAILDPAVKSLHEAFLGLMSSDISTAKGLQTFDGRKYFASGINVFFKGVRQIVESVVKGLSQDPLLANSPIGAELKQFDWNKLFADLNVSGGLVQGDSATVTIAAGLNKSEITLVKVDGRWIPAELAAVWSGVVQMAKVKWVPELVHNLNAQKPKIMGVVAKVEPLLGTMQNAKTQEEFNTAYRSIQLAMMTQLAATTGLAGLAPAGAGGVTPVTVIVDRPLALAKTREILAILEAASDKPQEAIAIVTAESGSTRFEISPVEDLEAFAAKLTFGEVGNVNPLEKEVRVSVPPEASESVPAETAPATEAAAP